MKLYLLFMVMDLFTLLAYPFVFMHGKQRQFSRASNVLVTGPVTPVRGPIGIDEHKKER